MAKIKIDIQSYPTFTGKHSDWKPFRRKFEALASIHGFISIMKATYQVPSVSTKKGKKFATKNAFLQSILEFSLAAGTALSRVTRYSKSQDGKTAWVNLCEWFHGQGSQEAIAKMALEVLTTHKLTMNSHGGAEVYMEKFEQALQELEEIGRSYDMSTAKLFFLNNITDDAYIVVKNTLEMNPTKTIMMPLLK